VAFLEGQLQLGAVPALADGRALGVLGDIYARELTMAPSRILQRQCFVSVECDEER